MSGKKENYPDQPIRASLKTESLIALEKQYIASNIKQWGDVR